MKPNQRPHKKSADTRVLLSVTLTQEQKAQLLDRAGRQPISAYVRDCLFAANDNEPSKPRQKRHSAPIKDHSALAASLAKIGQLDAAASLTELARLARLGTLPMTPETEAVLNQACADISLIKTLLMTALGVRER